MKFSRFQKFIFKIKKFPGIGKALMTAFQEFVDLKEELLEAAELHQVTFV